MHDIKSLSFAIPVKGKRACKAPAGHFHIQPNHSTVDHSSDWDSPSRLATQRITDAYADLRKK
jgi:hypothetical protein